MEKIYTLPELPYGYKDLEPHISEEQLTIHNTKHHQGYVDKSNKILSELFEARKSGTELDMKTVTKNLSFNLGGHILHSLFWENMAPEGRGGEPEGKLKNILEEEFGGLERFKSEFTATVGTVEGSGWGALAICPKSGKPLLAQIEKHNLSLYPDANILMVLDIWEHAFYLDYKNEKAKFINAFWNIVNWEKINERTEKLLG